MFINKRWVNDPVLTRAFIKGYQQVLQPGRYPAGCLFIDVEPHEVDINIHPRKEEVRFMHPRLVEREIQQCITKALDLRLSAQLKQPVASSTAEPFTFGKISDVPVSQGVQKTTAASFMPFNFDAYLGAAAFNEEPGTQTGVASGVHDQDILHTVQLKQEVNEMIVPALEQTVCSQEAVRQYVLIGQYKKTYLLLEQENGLCLIDQHAAHERVLYEQFVAQHGQIAKVQLLFPQILTLSSEDITLVTAHADLFSRYGIELEQFGPDSVSIYATPVHLKHVAVSEIIKQAISEIRELQGLGADQFEAAMQKKLYADMACKAAVKAGDSLTHEQMQQLLCDLDTIDNRFLCPHGRPTSWLLHHDEIKKKFKRDYRYSQNEPL